MRPFVIASSVQDGAVGDTMAVTADVCKTVGGKEFNTRADVRTASIAVTATIADSRIKRQPRGEALKNCCVCYEALAVPTIRLGSYPH